MNFLAQLCIGVLEWIIAQAMALGIKQYREIESEEASRKQSEADALALRESKDQETRQAALKTIVDDTWGSGENTVDKSKSNTSH